MKRLTTFGWVLLVIMVLIPVIICLDPWNMVFREKSIADYFSEAKEIYILADATKIDSKFFASHTKIKCAVFQDSVTEIEENTFIGCSELERVELPASLTELKRYAFAGCAKLNTVVVKGNLTEIGDNAFIGCNSLELLEFKCKRKDCKIDFAEYTDWGIPKTCKIRFADSCKNKTLSELMKENE